MAIFCKCIFFSCYKQSSLIAKLRKWIKTKFGKIDNRNANVIIKVKFGSTCNTRLPSSVWLEVYHEISRFEDNSKPCSQKLENKKILNTYSKVTKCVFKWGKHGYKGLYTLDIFAHNIAIKRHWYFWGIEFKGQPR